MAHLIIIYWRDIPAQVIAESGRGRNRQQVKIELPRRFVIAIDAAAMKGGVDSTDDYLAEWRKSAPEAREGSAEEIVLTEAQALEEQYDKTRLKALIDNNGWA